MIKKDNLHLQIEVDGDHFFDFWRPMFFSIFLIIKKVCKTSNIGYPIIRFSCCILIAFWALCVLPCWMTWQRVSCLWKIYVFWQLNRQVTPINRLGTTFWTAPISVFSPPVIIQILIVKISIGKKYVLFKVFKISTTKKDLTSMGSFLMMGLIGIIIASLVNL